MVAKHECRTLAVWQALEKVAEGNARIHVGFCRPCRSVAAPFKESTGGSQSSVAIVGEIDDDSPEIGIEMFGSASILQAREHSHEGFLNDVLGRVSIAGHEESQTERTRRSVGVQIDQSSLR